MSVGSTDGLTLGQDRLAVTEGRRADQNRAGEIMMTSSAAKLLGVHVGQLVPLGFYTQAQLRKPGFGTPKVAPRLLVRARQLWILFARNINAVPDPAVPVLSVLLVAIGALVFANLDAALPGLDAAHTPAALALRAE